MKFSTLVIGFILLQFSSAWAGRLHSENDYQKIWCAAQRGEVEVVLPDRTRADCLTKRYAVEVEFANKWYQAIGQALFYSMQTGKKAGILLIIEGKAKNKYWIRLNTTIDHFQLPIETWLIKPEDL